MICYIICYIVGERGEKVGTWKLSAPAGFEGHMVCAAGSSKGSPAIDG